MTATSRRLFFLLLALLAAVPTTYSQTPVVPAGSRFVFAHFKNDGGGGDERLYISVSGDGLNWTALNGGNPVWQPPGWAGWANVVRDPTIIYRDGFYWVGYTSGNYGNHDSFALVKSRDLLNWTLVGDIQVALPGATSQLTWNPVFFRDGDGSVHAFVNISPSGGSTYNPSGTMRTYETHPITDDWTHWSAPQVLQLPSTNTNEFFAWKEGNTYHAMYVDFTKGSAWVKVSSKYLITGWGDERYVGARGYEGGMVLKKPDGSGYRFYAEPGNGNGTTISTYHYCDLDPSFTTSTNLVPVTSSIGMRNGKITPLVNTESYQQWQSEKLGTVPASEQGATADPDKDGICNLLEASTGSLPLSPDQVQPLRLTDTTRFIYQQAPYLSASLAPERSADLVSWQQDSFRTDSLTLMTDGTQEIQGTDLSPIGSAGFIRLRATLPATPAAAAIVGTTSATPSAATTTVPNSTRKRPLPRTKRR